MTITYAINLSNGYLPESRSHKTQVTKSLGGGLIRGKDVLKSETYYTDRVSAGLDKTSLSQTGKLIAQALDLPDVRLGNVDRLRRSIDDGTYQVASMDIASKLFTSLLR